MICHKSEEDFISIKIWSMYGGDHIQLVCVALMIGWRDPFTSGEGLKVQDTLGFAAFLKKGVFDRAGDLRFSRS